MPRSSYTEALLELPQRIAQSSAMMVATAPSIFSVDFSLTPEDEKRLDEIMATKDDWFHRRKEATKEELLEQAKGCIDAYCDAEFGNDAEVDYTDLSNVKIVFQNTEDGLHGIQASVNLLQQKNYREWTGRANQNIQPGKGECLCKYHL